MPIGELVVLALETFLVSFCMKIMSVVITVIVYIKGSKTAKGHTASCSVVLGCFATYWVAKGNSCYLMGSSQNATNAL